MAVIGPRVAADLVMPSGIDGGKVFSFQMRNGKSAEEIIREAAGVIGAVNENLFATYGSLVSITEAPYSYYAAGDANGRRPTPRKVEGKQNDAVRGSTGGHMLPKFDYEDALAWTPLYLRDAYQTQIDADLNVIASNWRDRVESDIWTRALTNTENAIGTGYDVPWAIGTGTNVNFIPEKRGTHTFDSTHTHFLRVNSAISAANAETALNTGVAQLRHHGHNGRLVAFVSEADLTTYTGMTNFVRFVPQGFQTVAGNTAAPIFVAGGELQGMPGEVFGFFLSKFGVVVELRSSDRIPTTYGFVTKSYGANSPRNGIALREHPGIGFGLMVKLIGDGALVNPELQKVLFQATHGVGVNDRTNGFAYQIASGGTTYSNPTI